MAMAAGAATARSERRPPGPPSRRPRHRLLRRLVRLLIALVLLLVVAVGIGWLVTPSVADAPPRVAAQLAAHDAPALQGPLPQKMVDALLATEDSRFYRTPGIDPISVLKLPVTLVTGGDPGGATLEQQLAKELYAPGRDDLAAKAEEAVLALKLDAGFSKQQILRMYLDEGYYGHGFYGLTAAAQGYFGVAPPALSWAQASLLAGLFQAPSAYDPFHHPDAARARQAHVLDRLAAVGTLTRAQADSIAATAWGLRATG